MGQVKKKKQPGHRELCQWDLGRDKMDLEDNRNRKAECKALNLSPLDIMEKEWTLKNETREFVCYYLSDNIWEIAMGIGSH